MLNIFDYKKLLVLIFCLFLGNVVFSSETYLKKLTCAEILQRVDAAIDPENKGKDIKSFEINSKTKISKFGEFELDYQMIFKAPDKFKTTLRLMTLNIVVIFNGKDGYLISPLFGREKLPEKEAKSTLQQVQFMNVATKYSQLFSNAELNDELVEIDGHKCYEIRGSLPNYFSDIPLKLFIDCEKFYIRHYAMEIAAQGKQAIIKVFNRDFTNYDGIIIGRENSSQVGSTKAVNTIQSVKFNIDVDDKIFEISNY